MAGSLAHITGETGGFTMALVENMRDAHEALAECHQIIALLLTPEGVGADPAELRDHRARTLALACTRLGYPVPSTAPEIQPEPHGWASEWRQKDATAGPDRTHLLWSRKWNKWWRPNGHGYTDRIDEAGFFTEAEALAVQRGGTSIAVTRPREETGND